MSKSEKYYYDYKAILEPGTSGPSDIKKMIESLPRIGGKHKDLVDPLFRNKRSVWTIATAPFAGAHFATFPPALIEPMILAGCPKDRVILDPFFGSGTTGKVALQHGRHFVGIELNPKYIEMANERIWGKLFHVKALTIPQSHDKK
jgi:site-specific DNA-methyltransferase (adenine-specific)